MLDKLKLTQTHIDELVDAAKSARERAYAPYSHFRVGAAVLMAGDTIFTGSNVENVSYGLSNCAERTAIFNAVAAGEQDIVALAVVTEGKPVYPCGACLQVIQEFSGETPPMIIAANTAGDYSIKSLSECLPNAFKDFSPE